VGRGRQPERADHADRLWYSVAYNPSFSAGAVGFTGLALAVDRTTRHLVAGKVTWRADDRTDVVFTVLGDPTVHRMVSPAMWGMPEQVTNADAVLSRETSGGVTDRCSCGASRDASCSTPPWRTPTTT